MPTLDRLMILGLDGATWTVLDPMRRRGLMPNLDALLARAAHGTLRSTVPPITMAAWTTMMTGCPPHRHGIYDHRHYDANAGRLRVNHAGRVRVPTVWHALDADGRTTISLNLPVTYPPLPVRGIVVSGMDAPHLDAALSGAPEFAERLRAEIPGYHLRPLWKRPPESLEELSALAGETAELFLAQAQAGALADRLRPDWSALLVQFQVLDPFQHRAWRDLNVDETGLDDPPRNAAAGAVLRGLDAAIGHLLELAERRGAGVLVVSDHGFGPCKGRVHVNRILIDAGVARLPGKLGKMHLRAKLGVERLRLWSAKREDPKARSASFETSVAAQFPFDWKRTLAFAPHQDTGAMVYLNSRDRHPDAPELSPRQLDDARRSAAGALRDARHPESGTPLFPEVIATAEAYGVDPAAEGFPDLIALPADDYWVRTKLAPGSSWVEPDANLPGNHRPDGVVALAAPGIAPGRTLRSDLCDITPTILALLGLPIPGHVTGRPLPCLPETHVRRDAPSAPPRGPHASEFEYSDEEQAVIEQRLADLGYLE